MKQSGYTDSQAKLDAVFSALSDPTRREILRRLTEGELSVNELAEPFNLSQPAISRHLKVLEQAGLIERTIDEQRRPAKLKADNLVAAVNWLIEFRPMWGSSFSKLDDLLFLMQQPTDEENKQ